MYPSLVLKSGRDRSVNNRHPWIFSGGVKQLPKAENGDIVEVLDNQGNRLAYGFYSPQSQISCRLFEFSSLPIDFSQPDYWHQKIQSAYEIRKKYVLTTQTNCCRLLHAEGDFLPGVIADLYDDLVVLQLLIKGSEKIAPHIISGLQKIGVKYIYLKNKHNPGFREEVVLENGFLTSNTLQDSKVVLENGVKFAIDFERGQKTGFFLDQRDNRALLQTYSQGKKVLNAFSYTGGFSIYALAGGASEVHSVDISKDAVQLADENSTLNFGKDVIHKAIAEDCFEYLKNTQEEYDVIVLDPPAFAKNAKAVPNASRGYKELNLKGLKKIKPGGILFTFSCSQNIDRDLFRKIIFSAAADAHRNVRILHQLTQPLDHPVNIFHPEGEYLKGLVLQVE
ncbi:class I SAM-dependent rRNA methyltransferase [Cytophagaceae bacterium DM2B3-1]|uniref:Class I SAM-dependent rRNA methyltransferase n=1 Tax=Xanthocytophaga flava TaxID=3048013 RepID=A0ABT7CJ90_9BACT|nr:class I SAM-dependent rRNA methyltransferase [Xanthocytophaga flavus]MDJ1467685.1 class I SAM-dependent rRNA methyltransferase [Xanthocytophaga flavus]MDJ1493765.1 class I SAM-dependent rRNA methyltransferase [Xanthocytophaga flavus]